MRKKLLKKITQKTIIIIAVFVLIISIIFPTKSQAVDVGGVLAKPITSFALFLLDTVEGGLQYYFIGGPFRTVTVTFDAEEYLTIEKMLKLSQNKSDKKVEDDVSDYQSWISENFAGNDEAGWDYVVTKFSPAEIFSNKIPMFSINFIDPPDSGVEQKSIASSLQGTISSWYKALRMLAFVGMLSILVYVGIRIILSSTAADTAKYKNMIMDWVVALFLLFFLHYIMEFTIVVTDSITAMVSSVGGKDFEVVLKNGNADDDAKVNLGDKPYVTNLMGLARFRAQNENLAPRLIYLVIYAMLVGYTVIFAFAYLKRTLMMAFLTVISPIVVLTYPIDKISDGNAQGFDMWLKEYVFNALLQPVHCILYSVLVGSSIELAADNPFYAIAAMMFILPAEKIMRKFFNFQKAQAGTMSGIEGFAGGLLANNLISGVKSRITSGSSGGNAGGDNSSSGSGGTSNGKLRMQNKPSLGDAFGGDNQSSSESQNSQSSSSSRRSTTDIERPKNKELTPEEKARQQELQNRKKELENMLNDPNMNQEDKDALQEQLDYYNDQIREAEEQQLDEYNKQLNEAMENAANENDLNQAGAGRPELMTANQAQQMLEDERQKDDLGNKDDIRLKELEEAKDKKDNKRVIRGFKNILTSPEMKEGLKKGLKAGVRFTAGGGAALASGGIALATSGGDLSTALTAAAGGYAVGAGVTGKAIEMGKSIAGKASSAASTLSYRYTEGADGLQAAQRQLEQKELEKQEKEFMKDTSNQQKYKQMAYKLGTNDYKQVMKDAYKLQTSGIKEENVEKTLEVAYGKPNGEAGVGLDKAAAVAVQTQKYGKDVILDKRKSQVLEKKFANEIMQKGNGNISEQQAQEKAKDVIRIYERFT